MKQGPGPSETLLPSPSLNSGMGLDGYRMRGWEGNERRSHFRGKPSPDIDIEIRGVGTLQVVDLSQVGALLQGPRPLGPGFLYALRVGSDRKQPARIKARVLRSYVYSFHKNGGGETIILYRAALEFCCVEDWDLATPLRV